MKDDKYPVTPDGRYFVVRGRLWRRANPALAPEALKLLVSELMSARRSVRDAGNDIERKDAHTRIDDAKRALGERGPVWWDDGGRDYNRHMARNTPYAGWFAKLHARRE